MSGVRLKIDVSLNMKPFGSDFNRYTDKDFIGFAVSNIGDRTTTKTNVVGYKYPSFWSYFLRKRDKENFLSIELIISNTIPFVLRPGEIWENGFIQNDLILNTIKKIYFYFGIFRSCSNKPLMQRLR